VEDSWLKFFDLGIVHAMAFPELREGRGPVVEKALVIAEDSFFSAIEVVPPEELTVRLELRKVIEVSGLRPVLCAGIPIMLRGLDLNALDESKRRASVEGVKRLVDDAYYFGAEFCQIIPGPDVEPARRREAKRALVRSLVEVCSYASQRATDYELSVAMETFDRTVEKKRLIGPSEEAAPLAREVKEKWPNFGLSMDLSHLPLIGETPAQALSAVKGLLTHAHLGNCIMQKGHPLFGDFHPRFGFPGGKNGVAEVAEYLRELFATGFFAGQRPVVSLEVRPHGEETSELIIANAKRAFLAAWAQV